MGDLLTVKSYSDSKWLMPLLLKLGLSLDTRFFLACIIFICEKIFCKAIYRIDF